MVRTMPEQGKPACNRGLIMRAHCCSVRVVAGRGYCMLFNIVVDIDSHARVLGRCQVRIQSAHVSTLSFRNKTSASLLPSGAILTPKVRCASFTDNLCSTHTVPSQSLTWIAAGVSSTVEYLHCPLCHVKSIKYQCDLDGSMAPPVAQIPPSQAVRDPCIADATSLNESLSCLAVTTKSVSSTNAYPTKLIFS